MAWECNSLFKINTLNSRLSQNTRLKQPSLNSPSSAILDSGCTGNYLRPDAPVVNRDYTTLPIKAGTPNGATITSSCSAQLPNDNLPAIARQATIFPNLTYRSLLSVGQFCDAGYDCCFTAEQAILTHPTAPTIIGSRDGPSKMYFVDLNHMTVPPSQPHAPTSPVTINNVHDMRTKVDLATWLHLCAYSPVLHTWTTAIDRSFYTTWPGLTSTLVRKHLPKSIPTAKGHLKLVRKNVRSTKPKTYTTFPSTVMTNNEPPQAQPFRTNLVNLKCVEISGNIATDQTGRFPVTSSRGNKYIMVAFVQDPNAIMAVAMKSRSQSELVGAYTSIYNQLKQRGMAPIFQKCDNECPEAFKTFLRLNKITYQLVPPYCHRTNPVEKAIDTWK